MPKKRQPIEAKPTVYRGVQYKSRLEARWAVFLDHHHNVEQWDYEPATFTLKDEGWDYAPDFGVVLRKPQRTILLEIKPEDISEGYQYVMDTFAKNIFEATGIQLYLMIGDFYKMRFKLTHVIEKTHPLFGALFPRPAQALQIASQYRFDLKSQN